MNTKLSINRNDSALHDASATQRDKLLASYLYQLSTTRSNKSNANAYLPQDFLPSSTRGIPFFKEHSFLKPPSTPQGTSSHKGAFLFDQKPRTSRNRMASMTSSKLALNKQDAYPGTKRDSMPEISVHLSPNSTKEEIFTPKNINSGSNSSKQAASKFHVSPSRPKKHSQCVVSSEFVKGINLKKSVEGKIYEMKDSEQVFQDTIKGVVFSDSKERYAVYQKRFLALKAHSIQEPADTSSTQQKKKKPSKDSLTDLKQSSPAKDAQILREALAQHLPNHSPKKEIPKVSLSHLSPNSSQIREKVHSATPPHAIFTAKVHKRAGSASQNSSSQVEDKGSRTPSKEDPTVVEQAPAVNKNLEEKSMRVPSRNEPVKQGLEGAREIPVKSDEEYYSEFLESEKQTFDFEKMMVSKRSSTKPVKENAMFISVASPTARSDVFMHNENHITSSRKANFYGKAGENLLRSAFAAQVKEDSKQLPSSESTKQGSTCQSSKLTKASPLVRKGERREWEEKDDSDLEKLIGMIESEGEKKGQK